MEEKRMVVQIQRPEGESDFATYSWNGVAESAGYFKTAELEPYTESSTRLSKVRHEHLATGISRGHKRTVLIKKGSEVEVIRIFVKSQFRFFVLERMGIWNLHANGPRFNSQKDLKTLEDFKKAWQGYEHRKFTDQEWDILVPHLAAWTAFVRMVDQNYGHIYQHRPPEVWSYCFHVSGGASHFNCLNPLLDQAAEFFKSVSDITKERVIEFLAQTVSVL